MGNLERKRRGVGTTKERSDSGEVPASVKGRRERTGKRVHGASRIKDDDPSERGTIRVGDDLAIVDC